MDNPIIIEQKNQVILVPNFIYNNLIRNNLTFDDFLNLEKVINIFSLEDLSFVLLLNEQNKLVFNADNVPNYLVKYWGSNVDLFSKINNIKDLQKGVLDSRLCENNSFTSNTEPYEIKDSHPSVVFCILNPKMFESEEVKQKASNDLICALLKLLYGYNNYDIVARHPLFPRYLSLLQ